MKTLDDSRKSRSQRNYVMFMLRTGIVLLCASCNNDDPSPSSPTVEPIVCKMQTQKATGTGRESATVTYTYDYRFTFLYDEKGNQVGINSTYNYQYSDGKVATSSSSTNNQFDENGFIIQRTVQYTSTDKEGVVSNSSGTTVYMYEQDRLIKESHTSTNDGKTRDYSFSYSYDAAGKLTRLSNTYDNSFTTFEWNGNRIQKITHVDAYGNSSSPFLEYNKDGLLIKSIETRSGMSDEMRYEYDAAGQVIRQERYINAKPSSAYTTEYDNKENPWKPMYEGFKGHPIVPDTRPQYAPKHNITKTTSFSANATGQWEMTGSALYTYEYNAKDLPVDVITRNLDKDGTQVGSTRTSYEYQDCE